MNPARTIATALLCAAPPSASTPVAPPSDWPQLLGPHHDGVSREANWTNEGVEAWRKSVGLGYSQVAVAGGRLVTKGHDPERGVDRIVCLDAESGEELWGHEHESAIWNNFHGGGTLSSPAIREADVFASHREGQLFRLALATGELAWARDYADELGLRLPFHGCSGSPLVLGDRVYLNLGGTTLSIDARTGEVLWRTEDHGDGSYSNPVPYEHGGTAALLALDREGLWILDRESGGSLAFHPFAPETGGINAAAPLLADGAVFLSAAYDKGCAMVSAGPDGFEVVWESRVMRNKVDRSVLVGAHIYGFDESMLKCVDLEGNELWRKRGLGMGSVSAAGDRLLVLSSRGELIVAPASPEGYVELAREKALGGGVCWTPPVIADGRIYLRSSEGELVCRVHDPAQVEDVAAAPDPSERYPLGALPAAEALLSAHVVASGGEEAIAARGALHASGWFEILGAGITRSPATVDVLAPDRVRIAIDLGRFGTMLRGHDAIGAWEVDPVEGTRLLDGAAADDLAEFADLSRGLRLAAGFERLETVDRVEFRDHPCWAVVATRADETMRTLYFDVETGLLRGHEGDGESLVVLDAYRTVDGVSVATHRVTIAPADGAETTLHLDEVSFRGVDDPIDEKLFEVPPAIARLRMTPEELEAANAALRARFGDALGSYRADHEPWNGAELVVAVSGGTLVLEPPDWPAMELLEPDEEGRLLLASMGDAWVRFERDEGGAVTGMTMKGRDGEHHLPRLP